MHCHFDGMALGVFILCSVLTSNGWNSLVWLLVFLIKQTCVFISADNRYFMQQCDLPTIINATNYEMLYFSMYTHKYDNGNF